MSWPSASCLFFVFLLFGVAFSDNRPSVELLSDFAERQAAFLDPDGQFDGNLIVFDVSR